MIVDTKKPRDRRTPMVLLLTHAPGHVTACSKAIIQPNASKHKTAHREEDNVLTASEAGSRRYWETP
jgi:hypothetical protein